MKVDLATPAVKTRFIVSATKYTTKTRISRGGIDEIDPEDIIYGELTNNGNDEYGVYVDLIYLEGDILRTFSGYVSHKERVIRELKILLKDDKKFYLILIKEVKAGFAFKRSDIESIKMESVISEGPPSCIWSLRFDTGITRTLETDYQSYFTYGNTVRPNSMTNEYILGRVLSKSDKH
jgi:hypothetical protein